MCRTSKEWDGTAVGDDVCISIDLCMGRPSCSSMMDVSSGSSHLIMDSRKLNICLL
jgi:hypothetical protein